MIIYSVTVSVDTARESEWVRWMHHEHIPDVMATGCFVSFGLHRLLLPKPEADEPEPRCTYNVQYRCSSLQALEAYQRQFAPALQDEHRKRFEGHFLAFRTVLEEVDPE